VKFFGGFIGASAEIMVNFCHNMGYRILEDYFVVVCCQMVFLFDNFSVTLSCIYF